MFERRKVECIVGVLGMALSLGSLCFGAAKKHAVGLGAARKVAHSKAGDPAGALAAEDSLKTPAAGHGWSGEGVDHGRSA
jgi:hypothetical protein